MQRSATREFIQASLEPVLAGYVAITDTWGAAMTPELLELYPDAKVICTVRNPESWFKSWRALWPLANKSNKKTDSTRIWPF
jgi:Sulfotransferase domain